MGTHPAPVVFRASMHRPLLLFLFVLAFVLSFVLVSAALEGVALTQTLREVARDPATIWRPGLEGNTASHLLATVDCGAFIAAAAYFLWQAADQASRKSRRGEMLRAIMLGQIAFIAGASLILAIAFWSSSGRAPSVATTAGLAAVALLLVAAGAGARFWWLAGTAQVPLLDRLASNLAVRVLMWLCAFAFAAAVVLTIAGQFTSRTNEFLVYVLLAGAPILVASYGFSEAAVLALMRSRQS